MEPRKNHVDQSLVFGIGVNRSGTTWLYHFLRNHPECHFPALKELHYFNLIGQKNRNWRKRALKNKIQGLQNQVRNKSGVELRKTVAQLSDTKEWYEMCLHSMPSLKEYTDFLRRNSEGTKIVGDITPAYATLGSDTFKLMSELDPNSKFILLLRDPVERLWSNIRLQAVRETRISGSFQDNSRRLFEKCVDGEFSQIVSRSDYKKTISNLSTSVPEGKTHIEFYERLFTPKSLIKLTNFLGIAPFFHGISEKKHSTRSLTMSSAQYSKALEFLKHQYEFLEDRFDGNLPQAWSHQSEKIYPSLLEAKQA